VMQVRGCAGARVWRSACWVAVGLLLAGCSVSQDQEVDLGRRNAEQVDAQLPLVQDQIASNYVQALGVSLARTTERSDLAWRFRIVDSRSVNAFALPGGFIYVNRGIVERADKLDELAGVMGHEIGHVVKRHSVKQMQQQQGANVGVALTCVLTHICDSQASQAAIQLGGAAVFAKFSRQDEKEADEEGFRNVVRAGISPKGLVTFFQKLMAEQTSEPSLVDAWFSDHPLTQDRIADVQRLIDKQDPAILQTLTEDTKSFHDFKQRVHNLPPGPKPTTNP
jgi:beta-barrel assembly-enhancing protease